MSSMTTFDDIFGAGPEAIAHPKLRFWEQWKARPEGGDVRCEVRRPSDLLGYKPAKLYVHLYAADGSESHLDESDWDDELNAGLIGLGVRAIDEHNEAQRVALGLRAALRPAERRYGDGFFNAVLVDWVRNSSFAQTDPVREVLPHVHANPPHRGGGSFDGCRELIQTAIRARAHELTDKLRYAREGAQGVLASALAVYLDERFSVSVGRALGWK